MSKIKNTAKVLSVGSSFLIFGLMCFVGNIFWIWIIILKLYKLKSIQKFSRFWVRHLWKLFLQYLVLIKYIKYDAKELKKIEQNSNLIIANHPSLLDIVFLLSYIENANCIVKAKLTENIFLYPAIKCSGYILNTQNELLLEKGEQALKNGEKLIIFPEGTRTKDRIIFSKGAVRIALRAGRVITPVIIKMDPISLKKGQKWYDTPEITINYYFKVMDDIRVKNYLKNKPIPSMVRKLNTSLMELYEKELKQ